MAAKSKTLRLAGLKEQHLPEVLEIENANHGAPWSEASFLREIQAPQGVFLVAILDGKVVGYGGAWYVIDEAHIINVSVCPELQNQGIGRKIMQGLLDEAKSAGMLCSTLEVRISNLAAIHLYESLGYEQVAVRRKYYPDNREDAAVMWLYDLPSWPKLARSA